MLTHQSRITPVRTTLTRAIGLAFGIAAASLLTTNASATQVAVATTVVRYTDLDLSRPADAARLYVRLKSASDQVCGDDDALHLHEKLLRNACYHTALSDAVAKVNRSTLTSLHAAEPRIRVARRT